MSYCTHCGTQVTPGTAVCPQCGNPPGEVQAPQLVEVVLNRRPGKRQTVPRPARTGSASLKLLSQLPGPRVDALGGFTAPPCI